jgi:hypothetical protein
LLGARKWPIKLKSRFIFDNKVTTGVLDVSVLYQAINPTI